LIELKCRKMLFKVEKTSAFSMFDGSFRDKRVCFDPSIIEAFLLIVKESTPAGVFMVLFCQCLETRLLIL
jgi:hypothetical protein